MLRRTGASQVGAMEKQRALMALQLAAAEGQRIAILRLPELQIRPFTTLENVGAQTLAPRTSETDRR